MTCKKYPLQKFVIEPQMTSHKSVFILKWRKDKKDNRTRENGIINTEVSKVFMVQEI